ncbi:MAG: hypothetical protein Q9M29_02505 [Mariprofundaceae bacterium]|nr:hypothetical protein [Mariprofundaceae bacterium]
MRHKHIFRHPVGTMPTHARWYLAGVSVLALLLVAVHFAIQVRAQQEARRMVMQWMQQSGASVGWVRYRLLRSALTLEDVRLLRGGAAVVVMGKVLLHGDLYSLMDISPRVVSVEIMDADIRMDISRARRFLRGEVWPGNDVFRQVWASAQSLQLRNGRIHLQRDGHQAPLLLEQAGVVVAGASQQRTIRLHAFWHGAPLELDMQMRAAEAQPRLQASLNWRDVSGADLAKAFGLEAFPGRLTGSLQWHGGGESGYELDGRIRLADEDGVAAGTVVHGRMDVATWQLDTRISSWPVASWRRYAPVWHGYRLVAGVFEGEVTWYGDMQSGAWSAECAAGVFRDIRYQPAAEQEAEQSGWRIGRLQLSGMRLQMPIRHLAIARMTMADTSLYFMPGRTDDAGEPWEITVGKGAFECLQLSVEVNDGVFRMPPMQGEASWRAGGGLVFDMHTGMGDESGHGRPAWRLHGKGMLTATRPASFEMQLLAEDVPLVRMRPLVPGLSGHQGKAAALAGLVRLDLTVRIREGAWRLGGQMAAADVRLAYGANEWWAEDVQVDIKQAGMGLPEQLLSQIEVRGWQYMTALRPLAAMSSEAAEESAASPWSYALRHGHWGVERIRLHDGSISVGRTDAVWMDDISMDVNGLQRGHKARLRVEGRLDGGGVDISGGVDMRGESPHINLKGRVRNALPFFAGDWLSLSGAPRIIRGRLSADFSLADTSDGGYRATATLRLRRPLLESGVFVNDPLLPRVGFGMHEVFARLAGKQDAISLNISLAGDWQQAPFDWARAGEALLAAIRKASQKAIPLTLEKKAAVMAESQIRLHNRDTLSHNERARLRKLWRKALRHKKWAIDMVPQFSQQKIDSTLIRRIRYTQRLIETFMSERGIGRGRIFPVWPVAEHRTGETGAIRVRAGPS